MNASPNCTSVSFLMKRPTIKTKTKAASRTVVLNVCAYQSVLCNVIGRAMLYVSCMFQPRRKTRTRSINHSRTSYLWLVNSVHQLHVPTKEEDEDEKHHIIFMASLNNLAMSNCTRTKTYLCRWRSR